MASAIATAMMVSTPAPARADDDCGMRCQERVAKRQCSRSKPVPCFRRGALMHHVPFRLLLAIGRCESRLHWWARNPSGASGPMQFLPGTWSITPYRHESRMSIKWAPIAAAWLIRHDGAGHWNASRACWG